MTQGSYGVAMSDHEIATFFDECGDGVLAFGGDLSYAIPISFGYDVVENRVIFQFVFGPESKKRSYIETGGDVSLVTYDWADPDDWRSVIATGSLSPIEADSPAEVAASEVFAPRATAIPMAGFGLSADELDPQWYELAVEERHGRQAPQTSTD